MSLRRLAGSAVVAALLALPVQVMAKDQPLGKVIAELNDPDLFRHPNFTAGISGQMLQQVTLGGVMIVLPLFLLWHERRKFLGLLG